MELVSGPSTDPLDVSPILGTWWNTNPRTTGLRRVEISRTGDAVTAQVWAADSRESERDWGSAPVERTFTDGPASDRVCGYTATFDLGHARTTLQANMNHGLTVVAAFTEFTDHSGRLSYLSREFFYRADPAASPSWNGRLDGGDGLAAARADDRLPMLQAPGIDPSPLLHKWRNADEFSDGVAEIHCSRSGGRLVVRVLGIGSDGPIDWGRTMGTLHTDISATGGGRAAAEPGTPHYADVSATDAGPAFWAVYDPGFMRVHLQARINLGVLVVAMFTEFHDDSGRADYFHREVFIR